LRVEALDALHEKDPSYDRNEYEFRTGSQFESLGVEHRTRLSDDPWRYNDPDNLIVTDAAQNEQYLEALRRHGKIWPTGGVEDFVIRHQLDDQGVDFSPDTHR